MYKINLPSKLSVKALSTKLLAFGCWVLLLLANAALAGQLSNHVYQQLIATQKLADNKHYGAAIKKLNGLLKQRSLNNYEQANVQQQLGYLYYQNKNLNAAIHALEKAISNKTAASSFYSHVLYTLAQLYFEKSDYKSAIERLQRWFQQAKNPKAEDYALLAQAYYQIGDHRRVIRYLNRAMDKNHSSQVNQQWLLMLQHSYNKLGLTRERIAMIKRLIRANPKKEYILALASSYGLLDRKTQQLALLETAYRKNYLTKPAELLSLAALQFHQGAPYKAAKLLNKALKRKQIRSNLRNLKFLANCWLEAREYVQAIAVLQKASKHTDSGELDIMIGNSFFQMGKWAEAAKAYHSGLQKGKLKHPEKILLLAGQSYLNAKQFNNALQSFQQASQFGETQSKARKWIKYARLEQLRYENYRAYKSQLSAS